MANRKVSLAMIFGLVAAAANAGEKVTLFNGKDLSGWTAFLGARDADPADVWSVEEGVLVCKGKPAGYLRSENSYGDYVLTLEWRWKPGSKGGNSGVLLHTVGPDKIWPKSIEAQLFAGDAGDIWVIDSDIEIENSDERRKDRRHLNLTDGSEKPIGQWNAYEITCKGDRITLKINGELVNEAWNASQSKGQICLQSEGAEIHFRYIELEPVK